MNINRLALVGFGAAFVSALGIAIFAAPSHAQAVTVPTTAGQVVTVTWQGREPPPGSITWSRDRFPGPAAVC